MTQPNSPAHDLVSRLYKQYDITYNTENYVLRAAELEVALHAVARELYTTRDRLRRLVQRVTGEGVTRDCIGLARSIAKELDSPIYDD